MGREKGWRTNQHAQALCLQVAALVQLPMPYVVEEVLDVGLDIGHGAWRHVRDIEPRAKGLSATVICCHEEGEPSLQAGGDSVWPPVADPGHHPSSGLCVLVDPAGYGAAGVLLSEAQKGTVNEAVGEGVVRLALVLVRVWPPHTILLRTGFDLVFARAQVPQQIVRDGFVARSKRQPLALGRRVNI